MISQGLIWPLRPILASERGRYDALHIKQQRAVLDVLPFAGFYMLAEVDAPLSR